ncbi:MAG: UvrD-helicase domain-containing protein [Cryomorphaceae bacterium]|nr:UvrD-helicase domain-containing protein [Cryomorphaceae bacterium]
MAGNYFFVLQPASLSIFNASAGTGKTFTLTRAYLSLCLGENLPFRYREILALTFTNKAAAEMRTRMLSNLREIALGKPTEIGALIASDLNIDQAQLSKRADEVLRNIIHDLSSVSISTIDKFTYRLLRSFSFELGINPTARLRMDSGLIARQTVENLMVIAAEDGQDLLKTYLKNFVRDQMETGYSWNIFTQLEEIVANLHHENDREAVNAFTEKSLIDLTEIRKDLRKKISEKQIQLNTLIDLFESAFTHKTVPDDAISFVNEFYKFLSKFKEYPCLPSKSIAKNRDNFFLKKPQINKYAAEMEPVGQAYDQMMEVLPGLLSEFNLLVEVRKHFDKIALLGALKSAYDDLSSEEKFLNIGEFQGLVNKLTGSDTPDFIFERLGDRYGYFFIDEFQDTSILQWQNLKTLALSAMANNGSAMLVGDPKQSIYRWRGSNPEMFIDLISDKDPDRFSVLPSGQTIARYDLIKNNLPVNYRSGKSIVSFVHEMFIRQVNEETPSATDIAYSQVTDQSHHNFEGWVEVEVVGNKSHPDGDSFDDLQRERCIEWITEALESGFALSDIAIITRKNNEGKKVAEWIEDARQKGHPGLRVISNESFILDEQPEIRALIFALGHISFPHVKIHRFEWIKALIESGEIRWDETERHERIFSLCTDTNAYFTTQMQEIFPRYKPAELRSLPITEKCIRLMQMMNMAYGENVFLQALVEKIRSLTEESPLDVPEFLQWWNDPKRDNITIEIPQNLDAITIITIHKAKGLEWPVVIMPFTHWSYFNNFDTFWHTDIKDTELTHSHLPVKDPKEEKPFPDSYNRAVADIREKQIFDNINLLYVGCTRAAQRLHILCINRSKRTESAYNFFKNKLFPEMDEGEVKVYTKGAKTEKVQEKPKGENVHERYIRHLDVGENRPILRVGRKHSPGINETPAIIWGNYIHDVLQNCALQANRVDEVLEDMLREKQITREISEVLKVQVSGILQREICQTIAQKAEKLLSEQSILHPDGNILRPDLVAIFADKSVIVLDYKTGSPHPAHEEQIDRYVNSFLCMGYTDVTGQILYV